MGLLSFKKQYAFWTWSKELSYRKRVLIGILMRPFDRWYKRDEEVYQWCKNWLLSQPVEKLPEYYTKMNCWEWVVPKYKDYYDSLSGLFQRKKNKSSIISPLMRVIEGIVSEKELSRNWHLTKCGRTNEEFESWWDENKNIL